MCREEKKQVLWALIGILILLMLTTCGNTNTNAGKQAYVVTHTVMPGETLWVIAEQYRTPDRYILEFLQGIYELNYEIIFADREKQGIPRQMVFPGDRLEIRYWK